MAGLGHSKTLREAYACDVCDDVSLGELYVHHVIALSLTFPRAFRRRYVMKYAHANVFVKNSPEI